MSVAFKNVGCNVDINVWLKLQVLHLFHKLFLIFFQISLAFNMFSTLMLVEVKFSGI